MSQDNGGLCKNIIANLEDIGVSSGNIGFANVSANSEKFICIRENKHSAKSSLKIVDLRKGVEVSEKPMSADSAIMNSHKPHLALRASSTIQVFNIDTKEKISSIQVGFEVIYWNWLNEKQLLLISDSTIYRWAYEEENSIPVKWFDKSPSLNDCQIINAQTNKLGNWCFISGISLKNGKVEGEIQLFSEEKKVSQVIEGHAGNFFSFNTSHGTDITVFAFASRTKSTEMKLHLFQIDGNGAENHFSRKNVELSTREIPENDFPIGVIYDSKYHLLYVYTKFGFFYVIEVASGICLMNQKYSDCPLFLITPSLDREHHIVFNRKGLNIKTSLDIESFFDKCIEKGIEFYEPLGVVMDKLPLGKQELIYKNQFDKLKNSGNFQDALNLVAKSGKSFMRTFEYLSSIKDFPFVNDTSALLEYFAIILEDDKLNEVESLELVQVALKKKKLEIVKNWLLEDQIFCTSQLGNVVLSEDPELALKIYEKSNSEDMVIFCLAILGNFDEFKISLGKTNKRVDLMGITLELIKDKNHLLSKFISSIIEVNCDLIDSEIINEIFKADLGSYSVDIDEIISKNPNVLVHINSENINTQLCIRILNRDSSSFLGFLKTCAENHLEISKSDILPLLKDKVNLKPFAFCFESDLNECLSLSNDLVGQEDMINSMNLSKSDIKKIIFTKIDEDPSRFGNLCAKLGQFIEKDDFEVVKDILKPNVEEESFCDFLMFWSGIDGIEVSSGDILRSIIKLEDEERLQEFSQITFISDPKEAFEEISKFNYKSQSLKIISSKYNMHTELFSLFDLKNDATEASKYCDFIGQNVFWTNLINLLNAGISEKLIISLLRVPKDIQIIVHVSEQLEKFDKISILTSLIMSTEEVFDDECLLPLKLKVLSENDEDLFIRFISKMDGNIKESILKYCEMKNPKLAMRYYLENKMAAEVLKLSFKSEDWKTLSIFLINHKNVSVWTSALENESYNILFEKVINNSDKFEDSESASCLIKALVMKKDSDSLLKIMKSWLENNKFLRTSRSLQTLYLIHLIKNQSDDIENQAMSLDNYSVEEVLNVAISSGNLSLVLKILEKHEQWNYAFKIALYGLEDAFKAEEFAQKSGHSEAWHALAEFNLLKETPCSQVVKFAKKSGNFRRQKELIIQLHLNENYEELLDYLGYLKALPGYEPIYERETFFCLMKLGKRAELDQFINSASASFANELGKVLYREGAHELAANCFKQAGNQEKAASCYLQLGNLDAASDLALKCTKFEIWLDIVKFALNGNKPEIARKFGLKCAQSYDRIEELFNAYEKAGAYEEMLEIFDFIMESSAPPQNVMSLIGDVYCREFPEKLEAFISRYHSAIPGSFVNVIGKYQRWKEAFKFLLLRSNLDEALELVMKHPSIEFDHMKLTTVISKIKNQKILDNLLQYYFEYDPRMLLGLQDEFVERLEIGALLSFYKERGILFVFDKMMRRSQNQNPNNVTVSLGLNEHLIQINDYYGLIDSIKKCPSIEGTKISEALKSSEHRHFRILAAKFMANSGEFVQALSILVEEDALIETLMILSQSSNNVQYAEAILTRYARIRNAVMFVAVSYVLYDLLRVDVLFELCQRCGFQEVSLPIFSQILRHKLK